MQMQDINQSLKQQSFWPAQFAPETIVFHEDFDGICSAALLLRYFGTDTRIEPINYAVKNRWLKRNLSRAAVVDFLYHPDALWWFDHHVTSFINENLKTSYIADARHRWDVKYRSCPPLILDVLQESIDTSSLRDEFREWVRWSDIIDSALYNSPHQAVLGEDPCILLNQALSESRSFDLRRSIVRRIVEGESPKEIIQAEDIEMLWKRFREKQLLALHIMEEKIRIFDSVALCDITRARLPFVRYGVYLSAPNVLYSVMAYTANRGLEQYYISLSVNPWRTSTLPHANLGYLAKKYGGGGRETVASIPLKDQMTCSRIAEEIATILASTTSTPVEA